MTRRRNRARPDHSHDKDKADDPTVAYGTKLSIDLSHPSMAPRWHAASVAEVTSERFRKFQSTLRPQRRTGIVNGLLVSLYLTHFDGLVSAYYNRELARAMASADWALTAYPDDPNTQYLVEDAILRHCSCWDYMFQMLIHFLGIQEEVLPERRDKDVLSSMLSFDVDFIEDNGMTHVRTTPKNRDEALAAFRAVRRSIEFSDKGSRGDRFFRRIRRTYAPSDWLTEVKRLLRTPTVKRIHELRNQITHARPLSAQLFSTYSSDGIPGPALAFEKRTAAETAQLHRTLLDAHRELTRALIVCRTAIVTLDIPNLKSNTGVRYLVDTLECADCGTRSYLPRASPESTNHLCRVCGTSDSDRLTLVDTTAVSEPVWHDMVRGVFEDLKKLSTSGSSNPPR